MSYRVHAEWDHTGWWVLTADGYPGAVSQCRRLDQAPADIAEALTLITENRVDPGEIELSWHVPGGAADAAARAARLRAEGDAVQARAAEETRRAVLDLRAAGFSYRDIGTLAGISYQRAQQLARGAQRGAA